MWDDWSDEIRHASALALGISGNGRLVHDDLIARLESGSERTRVEVLRKLGEMKIITPRLVPVFHARFQDPYVSVRIQACKTAAVLAEGKHTSSTLTALLNVIETGFSTLARCAALDALAAMGVVNGRILRRLTWVIRFAKDNDVVSAAIRAVETLGLKARTHDIIDAISGRMHKADTAEIQTQAGRVLESFGHTKRKDAHEEHAVAIKETLDELCTRDVVAGCLRRNGELQRRNLAMGQIDHTASISDASMVPVAAALPDEEIKAAVASMAAQVKAEMELEAAERAGLRETTEGRRSKGPESDISSVLSEPMGSAA